MVAHAESVEETHQAARAVWEQLPESRVVDDAYYGKILSTLDRLLGLAGLRLARLLNDAQAPGQCAARWLIENCADIGSGKVSVAREVWARTNQVQNP